MHAAVWQAFHPPSLIPWRSRPITMHQSDFDIDPDIRNRLSAARLPAMPQILLELVGHCQTDEMRMAEVAALVAKDAALTARILGAANASSYHRAAQPVSLERALIALGSAMVRTLLISESVSQIFDNFSQSNSVDLRGFWKHSMAAAAAARMIAVKIGYPHAEEAYLAGLLHDVGRLALLAAFPEDYAPQFLARDDEALCAAEQRALGLTHAEAGTWLIERWDLDSFLADSVRYHHEPAARLENAHPLIRIGFIVQQLSILDQDERMPEALGALCGIGAADLASIRSDAAAEVEKAAGQLGIDLADLGSEPASHDASNRRLADQVRNLVLASEAGRSFAWRQGEKELLETVTQSACLLFDFDNAAILLLDGAGRALTGMSLGERRQRFAEFSIPLDGGGAIADAALQRRPVYIDRAGEPLGVAEEQLLRILGTSCLVCLPLVARDRCHGAVVGAASPRRLAELREREGFLQAFAAQVAVALKTMLDERDEAGREIAGVKEKYREAARRVAHEVNNPLSIIKNYLSVLDRKLAKREPVNVEMSILDEEIDRVGQIINGLAELHPASQEGTTEVNRVVTDVVRLFRDTEYVPPSVQIVVREQDEPFEIDGDADTLKQILVNLIKNAVEALPRGGEITIGNNGFVNRDGLLYVELFIKDTGPGIAADVMANLFSPVRSTKGEGHRGLGLSIVHGLVKKMEGFITCRSDKKGTTFEILLPSRTDLTPASWPQFRNHA